MLIVYLVINEEVVVSVVFVRDTHEGQKPVYFVSKVFQGPEVKCQKLKKTVFTLIINSKDTETIMLPSSQNHSLHRFATQASNT